MDMRRLVQTPKMKRTVWFFALLAVLSEPFVEVAFYSANLQRGAYSVNADSIGIPIFQFVFGWLVTLPVVLALIWFSLRDYPGSVPLAAYNAVRPIWSLLWSAFFLLLAGFYLYFAFQSVVRGFPLDVIAALLSAYVVLCLRSSIIYSRTFMPRSQTMRSV